jgi:hypothetical protein
MPFIFQVGFGHKAPVSENQHGSQGPQVLMGIDTLIYPGEGGCIHPFCLRAGEDESVVHL